RRFMEEERFAFEFDWGRHHRRGRGEERHRKRGERRGESTYPASAFSTAPASAFSDDRSRRGHWSRRGTGAVPGPRPPPGLPALPHWSRPNVLARPSYRERSFRSTFPGSFRSTL